MRNSSNLALVMLAKKPIPSCKESVSIALRAVENNVLWLLPWLHCMVEFFHGDYMVPSSREGLGLAYPIVFLANFTHLLLSTLSPFFFTITKPSCVSRTIL